MGTYAQNIEFDPGASYPWNVGIDLDYGDPTLSAVDQYGILGADGDWLWEVNTYYLYVEGIRVTSDERAKENIVDLPNVIDKLKNIETVKYDLKKSRFDTIKDDKKKAAIEKRSKNKIGFLAQNLQSEFPELVDYNEKRDSYSVNYNGMIAVLLKAIKEQQEQIDE